MEFEALARAVEEVAAVDPAALTDDQLNDAMVELHTVSARLEAQLTRITGVWDARESWALDDARTGASWLAWKCRIPQAAARMRVRLARALRHMPATEAAWAAGEIEGSHVRLLARARRPRTEKCFERDEQVLVSQAQRLRFSAFERAVGYWFQLADADGAESDAEAERAERSFYLSKSLGGRWLGDLRLDAIGGATLAESLRPIEDELFEADWAEAKARVGEHVTVADLARTPAQRRADALVEMAVRARTAPPDGRRPAPLFSVLVGYETVAGPICELADGTVLTPGSLVPWLTEAYLERVVYAGASRVIDLGVPTRLFTDAQRRLIELRDRTCFHESCDLPAERCQMDHVIPAAVGGPTTVENGRPACGPHNRGRHRRTQPSA